MRRALFAYLATAAFVTATGTRCVNNNFEDLVSKTPCGCSNKLSKCLSSAVELERPDQIQQCFTASGCKKADAIVGAIWFAVECQGTKDLEAQDELRKRQDSGEDSGDEETTTKKKKGGKTTAAETTAEETSSEDAETTTEKPAKTTKAAKTTKEPETTSAPSSADATTTSEDSTSTKDSTTASTPTSTTSDSTTTSVTAASETTGSTTTSLQCSVTNMITTKVCSVTRGKTLGCVPTITPSATCAPGVICQVDDSGNPICLLRDDHLSPSGIAVAIIFALSIVGSGIAIFIGNARSRAASRRREMERAALLGGGGAYAKKAKGKGRVTVDVEAVQPYGQRNPSEAHLPLIAPGGQRSDQQQYNSPDYFNGGAGATNPVSPNDLSRLAAAPKLHPGLGALGQDYR